MQTPADIVRALGGPTRVVVALGIPSAATVVKWTQRGRIPSKHWPRLIEFAERNGVRLTADALLRANKAA